MDLNIHMYTRVQAIELYVEAAYEYRDDIAAVRNNVQNFHDLIAGQSAAQVLQLSHRRLTSEDFRTLVYRVVARLWTVELRNVQPPPAI